MPEGRQPTESGLLGRMAKRAKELKLAGALAVGSLLADEGATEAKQNKPASGHIEKNLPASAPREQIKIGDWELNAPDVHLTFLDKNNDLNLNWRALIAPVQLEFSKDTDHDGSAKIEVPYEYSRAFAAGPEARKALRKEDHDAMQNYIAQKLKEEFADELYGWDFNEEVYADRHGTGGVENLRITALNALGQTSPEGPRAKGPDSILTGNIDSENIDLGELRALTAMTITEGQLAQMGVKSLSGESVRGEEMQFTGEDWQELAGVAKYLKMPGGSLAEQTLNLIIAYNNNEITDKAAAQALDGVIAAKRNVEISVDYKNKKKDVLLIPLPLLALLPLLLRRRRGGEPTPTPERPLFTPQEVPDLVRLTPLPPEGSVEYRNMQEETLSNDIARYYGDEKKEKAGINYKGVVQTYADTALLARKDINVEDQLALELLRTWRAHDIKARREAGASEEDAVKELNYENRPEQIQWARMHAKELLILARMQVDAEKNKKEFDAGKYLDQKVTEIRIKQADRILKNQS